MNDAFSMYIRVREFHEPGRNDTRDPDSPFGLAKLCLFPKFRPRTPPGTLGYLGVKFTTQNPILTPFYARKRSWNGP